MTTTTKTRRTKPTPKPADPRADWQYAVDHWEPHALRVLGRYIDRADEARAEFIKKIADTGDLAYQAGWMAETVAADYQARRAHDVLKYAANANAGGDTSRARLYHSMLSTRDEFAGELLDNSLRGNSTGEFHRAAENTIRAATSDMYREIDRIVREYERLENERPLYAGICEG